MCSVWIKAAVVQTAGPGWGKESGMTKFTKEESMLMMLYNTDSREELIKELAGMKVKLQPEEKKLAKLTNKVIKKLNSISLTATDGSAHIF